MPEAPDFKLMTVTNTTEKERRGIYTDEGYVTIEPGQSRVVRVAEGDLKANKDYFSAKSASDSDLTDQADADKPVEINPPADIPQADAYDSMTDDALRDMIEDRPGGKRPHHKTSRETLLETARKS